MLRIDGSFGEGGGQIIRTAIALSCMTKKPVRLENIRGGRRVPGLRPQHLTAIRILKNIYNARVRGMNVGSTTIEFIPREIADITLSEDVGTAGSIPLVLMALVPAVALGGGRLDLSISGGTDVPWSPTYEYTKRVLGEAYSRMGIDFFIETARRGYYPRGGGLVKARIEPCRNLKPIILDGGWCKTVEIFCSFSRVSGERVSSYVDDMVGRLKAGGYNTSMLIKEENARDYGGAILATCKDARSVAGIDSLYDVKRQRFERDMTGEFGGPRRGVDVHLSDMLVVPASMAYGVSAFRVERISSHLKTNLHVVSRMTGCRYGIERAEDGYEVRISGSSDARIH